MSPSKKGKEINTGIPPPVRLAAVGGSGFIHFPNGSGSSVFLRGGVASFGVSPDGREGRSMWNRYEICEDCMHLKAYGDNWNEPRYAECDVEEDPEWNQNDECWECDCYRKEEMD